MRAVIFAFCMAILPLTGIAQDEVVNRIIVLGNTGKPTEKRNTVLHHAIGSVLPNKTTVLFVGNNIVSKKSFFLMQEESRQSKQGLRNLFEPFRQNNASVYFVPGREEWDKGSTNGLRKIQEFNSYIAMQNDSLLKVIPQNGCSDPYELIISDSLVVVGIDTERLLYPFPLPESNDCECKTNADLLVAMERIAFRNRYKTVVVAMSHPISSTGIHGGYFTWKDHLFPFNSVTNFPIPLPLVGSLYPLGRKFFPPLEDLHHPLYKTIIHRLQAIFKYLPNVVVVSAHDKSLQINKSNVLQIISGSASEGSFAKKADASLFASSATGFVVMDYLKSGNLLFSVHEPSQNGDSVSFQYLKKFVAVRKMEAIIINRYKADTVKVSVNPKYDSVSKLHRRFFGENYRKEWAFQESLPVIRINMIQGGLVPIKKGGGMQTISLRLKDSQGKEWVIRNINKNAKALLPYSLQQTFAAEILDDEMSAQHPYSPLMVPVFANAVGIPHTNPVIGLVAPERELGIYGSSFANKVCLIEEREPLGDSDNTGEMLRQLQRDNDNSYNAREFFRARLLDMYIGDWDRHADQWRWRDTRNGKGKYYVGIPRDRDQALYKNEGIFPRIASFSWIVPTLQGFQGRIPHPKYSVFKTNFLNANLASHLSIEDWMDITRQFQMAMSDSVIEESLKRLPLKSYKIRHDELTDALRQRRNNLDEAMTNFYAFIHRIVDVQGSDKNESITLSDSKDGGILLEVKKISDKGVVQQTLLSKEFSPNVTKELRLYMGAGNDQFLIDTKNSRIKIRLIGGKGEKVLAINNTSKRMDYYGNPDHTSFTKGSKNVINHFAKDSLNTRFVPVNLYNKTQPLITAGYNLDDGILFGAGFRHFHQGFRKIPYGNVQEVMLSRSFSTRAVRLDYNGEWFQAIGSANLIVKATVKYPSNTQNFFGRGNETEKITVTDPGILFYRTRFNLFQLTSSLKWQNSKGTIFSAGPTIQYYSLEKSENDGRLISVNKKIGSYDSATIDRVKLHAGLALTYSRDRRNNKVFPSWGSYINVSLLALDGLNHYSRSFIQIAPEIAIYKSLNARRTIIFSDRIGGGITVGESAFYQSLFLGGQGNLYGFSQYRFAGQHMLFNNVELRMKLADVGSYIAPGQLGLTTFFDIGRVWEKAESSATWHYGYGGGLYFAPAQLVVLQLVAGRSSEGWYPYFHVNFRY